MPRSVQYNNDTYVIATTEGELVACVKIAGWLFGAAGLSDDVAEERLVDWLERQKTHYEDDEYLLVIGMQEYKIGYAAGMWG